MLRYKLLKKNVKEVVEYERKCPQDVKSNVGSSVNCINYTADWSLLTVTNRQTCVKISDPNPSILKDLQEDPNN